MQQKQHNFEYGELESRQLLAISLNGASGDLSILGTNSDDTATVAMVDASTLRATLNGDTQDFAVNSVQRIVFVGDTGNDQFQNSTSIPTSAYGMDGNDVLVGGSGDDNLSGGNGNDILAGSAGDDMISGNADADTIVGGEGNDRLFGGSGNDDLGGNEGEDFISGNGGDDDIEGGDDRDILSGNSGADIINGNGGNDTIYGGSQNDNLYGNDGNDTIFGLNHDDSIYGGEGDDNLRGQNGDDVIEGQAGSDLLSGNNGADTIRGGENDDTIYGGNHDDELFGDSGQDNIIGNAGDDNIYGGDENDTLSGNSGFDTILAGSGDDNLYGGSDIDNLFGEEGNDSIFGSDGNDLLFGGEDEDRLDGGNGNDRLYGEEGVDELFGGAGNDGLFGGIGGGDTLTGEIGSDRFLIWSGDTMIDRGELEAQIEFRNETSSWNETEIQVIDEGLNWMMEQAESALIVRDSLDTDPVIYSKWNDLDGAVGINYLTTFFNSQTGYTYDREIQFLEWNENIPYYNEQAILTTIHEVGHSWGSAEEIDNVLTSGSGQLWNNFLAISQWTDTNPNSFQFELSGDGEWWYHQSATFAYNYGRTNPFEDWSTVWEAAYEAEQGSDHSAITNKLAIFDQLMAAFAEA